MLEFELTTSPLLLNTDQLTVTVHRLSLWWSVMEIIRRENVDKLITDQPKTLITEIIITMLMIRVVIISN